MKNGLSQFDKLDTTKTNFDLCSMCGAKQDDYWETQPIRPVLLRVRPRYKDVSHLWTICDECDEGLQKITSSRRRVRMGAARS